MKEVALASAINAGASFNSVPLDLGDFVNASIQVSFSSGSLNGTLTLEASLDKVIWATVPSSSQAVAGGLPYIYSLTTAGYRYVRAVWTWTSGAGTSTVLAVLKEIVVKGA